MEKRQSTRLPFIADVEMRSGGATTFACLADLSEGGAFVDTQNPFPVGTPVMLRFALDERQVIAVARVTLSQPFVGMGVQFVAVDDASRAAIAAHMGRYSRT